MVVLPGAGSGLSYTNWSYSAMSVSGVETVSLASVRKLLAASDGGYVDANGDLARDTTAPLVRYLVNVTNTGSIDADDVVLGFLKPPGAGENGVPLQTLFGFQRVFVRAGESVSISLYPSLLDWTQVDRRGVRYALPGAYAIQFGVGGGAGGMGFAEVSPRIVMKLDDETDQATAVPAGTHSLHSSEHPPLLCGARTDARRVTGMLGGEWRCPAEHNGTRFCSMMGRLFHGERRNWVW